MCRRRISLLVDSNASTRTSSVLQEPEGCTACFIVQSKLQAPSSMLLTVRSVKICTCIHQTLQLCQTQTPDTRHTSTPTSYHTHSLADRDTLSLTYQWRNNDRPSPPPPLVGRRFHADGSRFTSHPSSDLKPEGSYSYTSTWTSAGCHMHGHSSQPNKTQLLLPSPKVLHLRTCSIIIIHSTRIPPLPAQILLAHMITSWQPKLSLLSLISVLLCQYFLSFP